MPKGSWQIIIEMKFMIWSWLKQSQLGLKFEGSFDGWLSKNVKEENNIGIEELCIDLMEGGFESIERHNLTLPRRGYRFSGSEGGGLLKPPLRNQ